MSVETNVYKSVNKFVEAIKSQHDAVKSAVLYFEVDEAFTNKFDRTCIRPILIQLKKKNKTTTLSNAKIEEFFEGTLIVSFKPNRKLPSESEQLCELVIDFENSKIGENVYHKSILKRVLNKKTITAIREQSIEHNFAPKEIDEVDEEEFHFESDV